MNQPQLIHPSMLAQQLAGMNEAQDNNPHCPQSSYAIGVITGFSLEERFRSGLSMCVEYQVQESGRPDIFPVGIAASETINQIADQDKNKRTRQQARLKKFLSAVYGIPLDMKQANGQPFDWVSFAVALNSNPSAPNGNAGAAIIGRRFKVVTEAEKKAPTSGNMYTPKDFHTV